MSIVFFMKIGIIDILAMYIFDKVDSYEKN